MDDNVVITPKTVSSQVLDTLRNEIIMRKIPPGTHITVKSIADRYGISYMPVREAIHALSGERLVKIDPYKGAVVMPINKNYVGNAYDIIGALEGLFIADLLSFWNAVNMEPLKEINNRLFESAEGGGTSDYLPLNIEFHSRMYSVVTNDSALELHQKYHALLWAIRRGYPVSVERVLQAAREHEDIMAAVAAKNPVMTREAIYRHTMGAKDYFLRHFLN